MKTFLKFQEYLTELFNNPWDLQDISNTRLGKAVDETIKGQGPATRIKTYKAEGDNGYIVEFGKDNAMEIHHLDNNLHGGYMNPSTDRPNPRFISTMMAKAHKHLSNGFPVRIIGTEEMFPHYHKIGSILARKHGYALSEPESDIHPSGIAVKSYIIQPQGHLSDVSEAVRKYL